MLDTPHAITVLKITELTFLVLRTGSQEIHGHARRSRSTGSQYRKELYASAFERESLAVYRTEEISVEDMCGELRRMLM